MQQRIGAVITGGDFQALGILRTLSRKNIPVVLLDNEHCISRYSKFSKVFFRAPSPHEEDNYLRFLIELVEKEKIQGWVIFPNNDQTVYILSKYKDILKEYYRVPTPSWDIIQNVYVKKLTYQLAEGHGIAIPKTYYPSDLEELAKLDLDFPVVIKPSIKDNFYRHVKTKAFKIESKKELLRTYKWVSSIIDPSEVLIQEFIPGRSSNLFSCCPFFKNGKSLMSITARRARQHPMDFGHASTFAEIVHLPELHRISEAFLQLIDYYGVAEVEFMKDPRDGIYKLIEVNPRIWGWHTLAIRAGFDSPYVLYQDMVGEEVEVRQKENHMKWIRLLTDTPTVMLELVRNRMSVTDYINSMKGKKEFAVFSFEDPLPFVAEILLMPYLWMKRGF